MQFALIGITKGLVLIWRRFSRGINAEAVRKLESRGCEGLCIVCVRLAASAGRMTIVEHAVLCYKAAISFGSV